MNNKYNKCYALLLKKKNTQSVLICLTNIISAASKSIKSYCSNGKSQCEWTVSYFLLPWRNCRWRSIQIAYYLAAPSPISSDMKFGINNNKPKYIIVPFRFIHSYPVSIDRIELHKTTERTAVFAQCHFNKWETAMWINGWTEYFFLSFPVRSIIFVQIVVFERHHLHVGQSIQNIKTMFSNDPMQCICTQLLQLTWTPCEPVLPPYSNLSYRNTVCSRTMPAKCIRVHRNPCCKQKHNLSILRLKKKKNAQHNTHLSMAISNLLYKSRRCRRLINCFGNGFRFRLLIIHVWFGNS